MLGLFSEGLIIGRNFAFQNGLGLTIKTVNPNSLWAYIREGLLWEGYLRLRFGGLIFFFGGGGGGEGLIIGILPYVGYDVKLKRSIIMRCLHAGKT